MGFKFNSLVPEMIVRDINVTKDFYLNKLGFKLEYERRDEHFVFLSYGESQFMFEQINLTSWIVGEMEYPYGRGVNYSVRCSDVHALYSKVLELNIPIYKELTERKYMVDGEIHPETQFLIQDPDGYLLRFIN